MAPITPMRARGREALPTDLTPPGGGAGDDEVATSGEQREARDGEVAQRNVLHEVAKGAALSERELLGCVLGARGCIGEGADDGPALPVAHAGGGEAQDSEGSVPAEDLAATAEGSEESSLVPRARDARFCQAATEGRHECEQQTEHGSQLGVAHRYHESST